MIRTVTACLMLSTAAQADQLVVTDIAPVHSLAAAVMDGVATPTLLVKGQSDPHNVQLKPSDAAMLDDATLVIWVGPALTPWMTDPLDALSDAPRLTLMETDGWTPLELHEDDNNGHDHGHDHGEIDPHAWLDPMIAATWAGHIADKLAAQDPENATLYRSNAATLQAELTALTDQTKPALAPFSDTSFIMPHDAFGYFEDRFDLHSAAAIADSDAQAPGPARLSALRDRMAAENINCVLIEPGPDQGWLNILSDGTDIKTATLDLIGSTLEPGPDLYPQMIRNIRNSLETCLG